MCVPFLLRIFSSQSPKKLMEVREDLHPFLRLPPFSLITEKLFLRKRRQGILAFLLGNQASGSKMAPKMCILLQFEN